MVQFKDYMISIRIEDCDNWLAHNEAKIFCDAMRFKFDRQIGGKRRMILTNLLVSNKCDKTAENKLIKSFHVI